MSPQERATRIATAEAHDGGLSVPPADATRYGLTDPDDIAWANRRMTPQPLSVESSGLTSRNPPGNGLPGTCVRFTKQSFANLLPGTKFARTHRSWRYLEIAACHDAIISDGDRVCEVLEQVAANLRHWAKEVCLLAIEGGGRRGPGAPWVSPARPRRGHGG